MKGWNDPPPASVIEGSAGVKCSPTNNPFRRPPLHSTHKRSSSGGFTSLNSTSLLTPNSNPIPSIFVPTCDNNPTDLHSAPGLHPLSTGSRSCNNFEHLYENASASSRGSTDSLPRSFNSDRGDVGSSNNAISSSAYHSHIVQSQNSCPGSLLTPGNQNPVSVSANDLATALQKRLLDLNLQNSEGLGVMSPTLTPPPVMSPRPFSPITQFRSNSPVSPVASGSSFVEGIEPTFDISLTLDKVDHLNNLFINSTTDLSQMDKLNNKITIFKSNWPSFSHPLCSLIHKMVHCMLVNEYDLAMKCFVKLSVEYSNDVVLWSMAFKRLIRHFQSNPIRS